MKIHHYSVFAASPGGGKQFAIVEGVDDPAEMQRIAASSGQPLTGFILNADSSTAEVRFFSPTKEKGSSDSGALVVGEHLRGARVVQDRLVVNAGGEGLEVFLNDGKWWSEQGDMYLQSVQLPEDELLMALSLSRKSLSHPIVCAGRDKVNVFVTLSMEDNQDAETLRLLSPDLEAIAHINKMTGTNGLVVLCEPSWYIKEEGTTDWAEIRFFAPAKGISEDNAGSYTVASLCGLMVGCGMYFGTDYLGLMVRQGGAMGKPSTLYAHCIDRDRIAKNIQVGGKVELLEVTDA